MNSSRLIFVLKCYQSTSIHCWAQCVRNAARHCGAPRVWEEMTNRDHCCAFSAQGYTLSPDDWRGGAGGGGPLGAPELGVCRAWLSRSLCHSAFCLAPLPNPGGGLWLELSCRFLCMKLIGPFGALTQIPNFLAPFFRQLGWALDENANCQS